MNFSLKKILLTTFIILEVSALFAFSAFPKSVEIEDDNPAKLLGPKVTVSFEIARRRDCMGFGFCNVTFGIELGRINSCVATMYTEETSRNMVILEIDKAKGITTATYDKYFKSGIFIVEDDSPIPVEALRTMGISTNKTFAAGNHKITEKNGMIYIAVPIK